MKGSSYAALFTPQSEFIGKTPWCVYPRPQLKRDSFFCLNGVWDFSVGSENFDMKILVPFAPESMLSGIYKSFPEEEFRFYKKEFSLPEGFVKDRVILHFGAVLNICEVFLNGESIGSHVGGYDAFCFDITRLLKEKNTLVVKVKYSLKEGVLPYGKSSNKRGGMWYTPVSGIWQTVWIESVPQNYIKDIKIDTTLDSADIKINGADAGEITVKTPQGEINAEFKEGRAEIIIPSPEHWSPENPYLYYFEIKSGQDKIESYFALRTLEIKEADGVPRILLNGKPYFFNGLLDQGYFPDGLFTPATPAAFTNDIREMRRLGFNMLRKHIKIEPESFYYDCDRLGMVVFQDMVNNGDYNFIRDTALPTVGIKRLSDKNMHKDKKARAQFESDMEKTVSRLYNHPSICYWTIFNEGWGQFCSSQMYHKLKKLDSTRIIDSASGWFFGGESDVRSEHVYFKPYKFKRDSKPVVLSEFGGYCLRVDGHIFNLSSEYGYKKIASAQELQKEICALYERDVVPAVKKGLCAAVYTQVSDVEDEINGILTYDRKICKLDGGIMRRLADKIYKEIV